MMIIRMLLCACLAMITAPMSVVGQECRYPIEEPDFFDDTCDWAEGLSDYCQGKCGSITCTSHYVEEDTSAFIATEPDAEGYEVDWTYDQYCSTVGDCKCVPAGVFDPNQTDDCVLDHQTLEVSDGITVYVLNYNAQCGDPYGGGEPN